MKIKAWLSSRLHGFVMRLFRLAWPVVTYEWCVIGNTTGRHFWKVELKKCRNGTPEGAYGFLTMCKCDSESAARQLYDEFTAIAKRLNDKIVARSFASENQ